MASAAWGLPAMRHQPLPVSARIQERHAGTPRSRRKSAIDFARFGPMRRNAFAGADEPGGPSLLALWEMPQLASGQAVRGEGLVLDLEDAGDVGEPRSPDRHGPSRCRTIFEYTSGAQRSSSSALMVGLSFTSITTARPSTSFRSTP